MNSNILKLMVCATIPVALLSCKKDEEPVKTDYIISQYENNELPEKISFNGGTFKVNVKVDTLTKSNIEVFLPWQYRLVIGGEAQEAVKIEKPTKTFEVNVPENYTESTRTVAVEAMFTDMETFNANGDATPGEWKQIASAEQDCGLFLIEDFWWAKGNIDLKDGKFIIAEKMSDPGLFFKKGSSYGIRPVDGAYDGTAYTPEPVKIEMKDIPSDSDSDDPCTKMSPELRLPTYMEAYYLYYQEDTDSEHSLDGIKGRTFKEAPGYFLPYTGAMFIDTGKMDHQYDNAYGGYWIDGRSYDNEHMVYVISDTYSMIFYDLTNNALGSVRCVKNIRQPSYVSHKLTPEKLEANTGFELEVETDPGEFALYEATLISDTQEEKTSTCTPKVTKASFNVSANTEKADKTWKLFINSKFTGKTFVQPAIQDYAFYVSHTPAKNDYKAFTLTVNIDTDLGKVAVEARGSDGNTYSKDASRFNPVAEIPIPENTKTTDRTFSIFINGIDTGKKVVQAGAPAADGWSVIWSTGYLTIKDGAYTFAGPKEHGMYFKWRSKYGIDLGQNIKGTSKYPGKAYGPKEETISYTAISKDDTDPCSLVLPAGTWRLPTAEEMTEMTKGGSVDTKTGAYYTCTDGKQTVCLMAGGQLKKDGSGVMSPTNVFVWTGTKASDGKCQYLMWMSSASGVPKIAGLTLNDAAHQVRCVKSK